MKISVYIATSLDGFIARRDGDLDWLHDFETEESSEDFGYAAFMADIDVIVMGRHTFAKVQTFKSWPYEAKHVIVLSHHQLSIPANLSDTVEASSLKPHKLLSNLRERGFKHAYIDGGMTIQSFLCAGAINELTITRVPRLIGDGVPLFGILEQDIVLRHLRTQAYPNGFVQSQYEVLKPGS